MNSSFDVEIEWQVLQSIPDVFAITDTKRKNVKWEAVREDLLSLKIGECIKLGPFEKKTRATSAYQQIWKGHREFKRCIDIPTIANKEGWRLSYRIKREGENYFLYIAKFEDEEKEIKEKLALEILEWAVKENNFKLRTTDVLNNFYSKASRDMLLNILRALDGAKVEVSGKTYQIINELGGQRERHLEKIENPKS